MRDQSGSDTSDVATTYERLVAQFGANATNLLGDFALEFAEGRANLNKEQAFFYLALYQYAISREQLLSTYLGATNEKHPDVRRRRS